MNEKIKIAVLGLGRSGWRNHLMQIAKLPHQYEIVGASDPQPERCREAEEQFRCPTFETFDELLVKCRADWLVIATPSHLHEAQTIAALNAGFHVLCEKPMTGSLHSGEAMATAAQRNGRHLSVFHNRRYAADFLKVREIVASGCLGRLLLIKISLNDFARRWDWQTLRKNQGGALFNAGPHFLDQALILLGQHRPTVRCQMEKALTLGDAEDHVKIVMHAPHAPVIEIELSSSDAYGADRWKIYGTSGGLKGSDKAFQWKYTDWSRMPRREREETFGQTRSYNKEELIWVEEHWGIDHAASTKEVRFYEDLHRAIMHGEEPPISIKEALRVVGATEQCWKSAHAERSSDETLPTLQSI